MKNAIRVKGTDFTDFANRIFSSKWDVSDLPFYIRKKSLENVDLNKLPIAFNSEEETIMFLDKIYFLNLILKQVKEENLKHLNIILNPTIKQAFSKTIDDLVCDAILIRHNRIFVIQFAYDTIAKSFVDKISPANINYKVKDIISVLKFYLLEDSKVDGLVFSIKENYNLICKKVSRKVEEFFSKTTNRELLKMFA